MKFKETETLELKKSTSELKEAIISISSILNKHRQGELYFGIKNDGTVCGQDVTEKTLREISNFISDNIEPKIYPEISQIKLNSKCCIKIHFKGNVVPYLAFGRAYIRVGDENRQLSARELERLILEKNNDKMRWDTEICPKAQLKDISSAKVKEYLKKCGLSYATLEGSLKKLNLVTESGKLLNAAVILFGKRPHSFFPNAKLRCAVFATTDTVTSLDMKDFEGDLFYLIKQAEEYVLQNIHIGMRLEGLYRVDVPEIDKEAFREAIINAFCHRDYHKYDSVNIAVFKDRVEVRSPGLLYGGLTIARIRHEMVSVRRNELIAELFHRIHLIERWGKGIKLILAKEPKTIFKEVGTLFITVFKRKNIVTPQDATQVTTQAGLSELETKILNQILRNSKISRTGISKYLKISPNTVKEYLQKLKKKNVLKRVGQTSSGHWEVVEK